MRLLALLVPMLMTTGAAVAAESSRPDLVVELHTPMTQTIRVTNQGSADAGPSTLAIGCSRVAVGVAAGDRDCTVRGELSRHADRETTDVITIALPAIKAGATRSVAVPYWKQLSLNEEQAYRFEVVADADEQIDESDEDNNVARSQMTRVWLNDPSP